MDPFSIPASYLFEAQENGAVLRTDCEVKAVTRLAAGGWTIHTTFGSYEAAVIVNAAGMMTYNDWNCVYRCCRLTLTFWRAFVLF